MLDSVILSPQLCDSDTKSKQLTINSFVLLIALSTHALFEGIALGLTKDLSASLNIMIALAIHKTAASASLGIAITKTVKVSELKKGMVLINIFAIATPLGIVLGLLLNGSNPMMEIVLSSFAGGTFIYIAASEVIVNEFNS